MTIKDINPLDFADYIHRRIEALDDLKNFKPGGCDAYTVAHEAQRRELCAIARWAAQQIFGEDKQLVDGFLRQAGAKGQFKEKI